MDRILQDRQVVNSNICDLLITKIQEQYTKPGFQYSAVALMFFLLWPTVRFLLFLVSILFFLIFKFFNLIKIYHFHKITDEVEQID